jgi:DNA-binding HxlR family transcriptional regulator
LSIRLRELEELGLIKKRIMGENRPLSVEYMLTRDGKKLRSLIIPILAWIEENSKN